MTLLKGSVLSAALLGSVGLGIVTSPHIASRLALHGRPSAADAVATTATRSDTVLPAPRQRKPAATLTRGRTTDISPGAPVLHRRLRPLLNDGADMSVAFIGFRDAEQFASVAHAARNTGVPFMLLKHRVVNKGKSLTSAIHELKPGVDAAIEAARARAEARSDLASL